jgi:aryl-alcohol dehydrogenase-like predicted oxidoreductase
MEMRQFGKTDMKVSVLGFGGAEIGFEKASDKDVARLLGDALDAGLNVIDTAECYLDSEEKIGRAVSHRRADFHLFTKCGHPESPSKEDWRPESLLQSIELSLKRLKTDRVDLVQLHSCSEGELRKGDVIAALQMARQKGYTRYIGYSGDSHAARYAIESGAFDALQTSVSIADQEAIDLTLPLAREARTGVIAKRPIANAAWRYDQKPENTYHQPYWERLQKLDYDFVKGDPKQAVSVALRFTLCQPGVCTAIVGTTKPGRWRENAALLEAGPLSEEQLRAIFTRWRAAADASWVGQI